MASERTPSTEKGADSVVSVAADGPRANGDDENPVLDPPVLPLPQSIPDISRPSPVSTKENPREDVPKKSTDDVSPALARVEEAAEAEAREKSE